MNDGKGQMSDWGEGDRAGLTEVNRDESVKMGRWT